MKAQFYPLKKAALLLLLLLCIAVRQTYAQVYANAQTNGTTGVCLLCGVSNPGNPVNNSNLTDYSTFNITAGLLGVTVYQTLIFPSASSVGCDSLVIGIGSGNAILSANLLGGVSIQTFNGATPNGDSQVITSPILRILENNTQGLVSIKPTKTFDRVKITLSSSLVGLLNSFQLYYAYRTPAIPPPNATDSITICAGQTTAVTATTLPGATISWYSAATGGTLLATGSSYNVSPAVTTTYYAEASLGSCKSIRKAVKVIVRAKPANPAYTVPQGLTCGSFNIPITNHQIGFTYNVLVKYSFFGTPLFDTAFTVVNSNTVTTPNYTATRTAQADIYIQTVNPITGCKSDTVHKLYNVNAAGGPALVDFDSVTICKYDSVTLHAYNTVFAGAFMRWYDAPVGGNLLYTGSFYKVSPAVTTTYYAATSIVCENPQRKAVKVTVTKIPDPITSVTPAFTCGPVKIAVLNHQPGYNYRVKINYVYLFQTIFDTSFVVVNKDTIVTPNYSPTVFAQGETYIQAIDPVSGCRSDTTFLKFILSGDGGAPVVDADSVTICKGDSVTLHAYNPINDAFNTVWYDAPTGGNLLFTGNYFKVSPAATTTYYVTSRLQCEYKFRKPVKVKVNLCSEPLMSNIIGKPNTPVRDLTIYPNPTDGTIRFITDKNLSGSLAIVRDINGREVQRTILTQNGLNLSAHLPEGIYFLQVIKDKQEIYRGKVILRH
ncbi:Ig-like domain-containing protein [Chitinophaga nivalis]|uniref:T9SS type A sorting domain-containing protein n=1 Tax=Chitinophaga nivalis TaxID=2991709 RepID=A0ABT3II66_9BACT|nr:T9SS type A sorting domain-containing protein [Chitinophaga nivalis]MCW3466676.1 T9SS type A sorting domain-containing protein [Chitinophaga nivalis]MCW3483633.1 T9SS type A sorting domain-containing protein [Chitinophaga nivalis]